MFSGLLPVGTVVLLKDSTKKIMIIGVLQRQINTEQEKIWDYAACFYPEGFMGGDKLFLFDHDQIERVFAVGYQDEEQFSFKVQVDALREKLHEADKED